MELNDKLVVVYGLVHIMGLPVSFRVQREMVQKRPVLSTIFVLAGMCANMAFLSWADTVWLSSAWIAASLGITAALAWCR